MVMAVLGASLVYLSLRIGESPVLSYDDLKETIRFLNTKAEEHHQHLSGELAKAITSRDAKSAALKVDVELAAAALLPLRNLLEEQISYEHARGLAASCKLKLQAPVSKEVTAAAKAELERSRAVLRVQCDELTKTAT